MAKPRRIILVRHGQSIANARKEEHAVTPDYALWLTDLGHSQARKAGETIRNIVGNERVRFYVSSYRRTRETFGNIVKSFESGQYDYRDDPRLRELEWNRQFNSDTYRDESVARDAYGKFYYRFMGGENCCDVYDRISGFLDTLHRDFHKPDYPENTVIVGHGMMNRVFLMRWFHWSVEYFDAIKNPKNAAVWVLEKQPDDKYKLVTPLEFYEKPTHPFQFELNIGS